MQQQLLYQSLGLFLLSLAPPAWSFSRGAGHSACQDLRPGHIRAHPQDPQKSHVSLRTSSSSYLPGQLVTVTVRSSRDFMGFLLQARRVDGLGVMISDGGKAAPTRAGPVVVGGSWALVPPGTHTLRCLSEGDTLTHSDKQLKRNLSFVWKAPNEPIGDIRFYITVVQSYFVYWAGIESEVVRDKSRALWRWSDTTVKDGLSSVFNNNTPDLWINTTQNNNIVTPGGSRSTTTQGPTMSTQNYHFATGGLKRSSTETSAATRNALQTVSPFPEKNVILRSHQNESNNNAYTVTKDSNTETYLTAIAKTESPSTTSFSSSPEKNRDDVEGLNLHADFDTRNKTQDPQTAGINFDDTTKPASPTTTQTSQHQTSPSSSPSKPGLFMQQSDNNKTSSQSYNLQTLTSETTPLKTRASANLFTIVHRSTDSPTDPPEYSMSLQTGAVLSSTQVLQQSLLSSPNTAQTVGAKSPLQSNVQNQHQTSSSLGLLLQPQTSRSLFKGPPKQNPLQANQSKPDTAEIVQRTSPLSKSQTYSTFDFKSSVESTLASLLDTTRGVDVKHDQSSQAEQLYSSESLDVAVDSSNQSKLESSFSSTSTFASQPLKYPQFSTTKANQQFKHASPHTVSDRHQPNTRSSFSAPPAPSPIPTPPRSPSIALSDYQKPLSVVTPSSRPSHTPSTPAALLPSFASSSSTSVVSSSSPFRSSPQPSISSPPLTTVISKASVSSLLFGPSVLSTHSSSAHPGPSPALRRALINPSQTQTDSATPTPEVHLNPKPHPNLNPKVKMGNSVKPNAPKTDKKLPPKPFETPDTGGKYPDIIPRHTAWEVGMLLGCSVGLGMMLVFGVRYMYRQACGKRTEVTLHDRERRYATGERGLIHVQECGDLVRVRRLRENSFVLLAEYDILASAGD